MCGREGWNREEKRNRLHGTEIEHLRQHQPAGWSMPGKQQLQNRNSQAATDYQRRQSQSWRLFQRIVSDGRQSSRPELQMKAAIKA